MTTPDLTVTTPSGIAVEVTVEPGTESRAPSLVVAVPSQGLRGVDTYGPQLLPTTPQWAAARARGATHLLCLIVSGDDPHQHRTIPVGLGAAAAQQVTALLATATRGWNETPQRRRERARTERERLLSAVRAAGEEIDAAKERAHRADTGEGWDRVRVAEAHWETAHAAVVEYEAAHPDLMAELAQERRDLLERAMWH